MSHLRLLLSVKWEPNVLILIILEVLYELKVMLHCELSQAVLILIILEVLYEP